MTLPKNSKELVDYEKKITGCCPICEGKIAKNVEQFVRNEIVRFYKDPTYEIKFYGDKKK